MNSQGTWQGQGFAASAGAFELISREELRRLSWEQGLSDVQIAQMYGVTANRVHEKRRQMNLIAGQVSAQQLADIVRLAERIKALPLEAVEEIRQIVDRYTS